MFLSRFMTTRTDLMLKGLLRGNLSAQKYLYSTESNVNVSTDDHGITTLSLNKPPVNSLGLEFMENIIEVLDTIEKDSKGMVLTSSNKSIFCAGLDLKEMYQPEEQR